MEIKEKYKLERKEVSHFMRRLYKHGLTNTSGGNGSLRLSDDLILITPSATDKGRKKWKKIAVIKAKFNTSLISEAKAILGDPLFVRYAVMGSPALAEVAAENIMRSDILLLENHGIATIGRNLLQAFDKIEVLENAARMTLMTEMSGKNDLSIKPGFWN